MSKIKNHVEQIKIERDRAIRTLQSLGGRVSVMASGTKIEIIVDDIEVTFKDGEWKVVIDGEDWTERIVNLQVIGKPFQFPSIVPVITTQIPININSDEYIGPNQIGNIRKSTINAKASK